MLARSVARGSRRRSTCATSRWPAVRREARLAGSLSHPNVVTVFDFIEQDGTPYTAMENLDRGSSRPSIGKLSVAESVGVLEGVLVALSTRRRSASCTAT